MAEKIATRESYGSALVELADKYDFVVLDADLAEATKTIKFKKAYPDRFFDCGIAEGNMMSVAAGIAAAGKPVFASSFAMFGKPLSTRWLIAIEAYFACSRGIFSSAIS